MKDASPESGMAASACQARRQFISVQAGGRDYALSVVVIPCVNCSGGGARANHTRKAYRHVAWRKCAIRPERWLHADM